MERTKEIQKKSRQVNIELFRIMTMVMIVLFHFLAHGGVLDAVVPFSTAYYFCWSLMGLCYIAVNGYVLVTGYFQITSSFKLKKLVILILETFFYSMVIYVCLCASSKIEFTTSGFLTAVFPVINSEYWFVTIYVGLYILSPFLNWPLQRINKRQHFALIAVLLLLFSIWPSFAFLSVGLNFGGGFGIAWFIVLYCIGAYIRKYYTPGKDLVKWCVTYVVFAAALPLSKFGIAHVTEALFGGLLPDSQFYTYNSILVVGASVSMFVIFLHFDIKNRTAAKAILFLSSSTFGVYLIHDNPLIREKMWGKLQVYTYLQEKGFILFMAAVVCLIYLGCTALDKVRMILFKKLNESRRLDRVCRRFTAVAGGLLDKI